MTDQGMSRDSPLFAVLARIHTGIHLAGVVEQAMILNVLKAIAERLLPEADWGHGPHEDLAGQTSRPRHRGVLVIGDDEDPVKE
jgi:hypothetical protein